MGKVLEFERELNQQDKRLATWMKVDLHNHTPASFDYECNDSDIVERLSRKIVETNLAIVMFTDHNKLPDTSFIADIQRRTQRLIITGVELNVFVNAFDVVKVDKNLFFHLLIGFDPDAPYSPEYWFSHLSRKCTWEERYSGGTLIKGVTNGIEQIQEFLDESNAILIPAHLHSGKDAFKSRSVDKIFSDREFLKLCKSTFSAVEVVSKSTATFFDGQHEETDYLYKSCIQSSDSHHPDQIGWRPTHVLMENATFAELKAALDLPFRINIEKPEIAASYVVGIHVSGAFLKEVWHTFSPYCNLSIGVKGSGKTSLLECLRFGLGADVPESKRESVNKHVQAILGPAGVVRILIKREDGSKLLVERAISNPQYKIVFEDDRVEHLNSPESLMFPITILGWHEIEQAADDPKIRKLFLNTISGKEKIRRLEETATSLGNEIRRRHDQISSAYLSFRSIFDKVNRLKEMRKGLAQLTEANLIKLRDDYLENLGRLQKIRAIRDSLPLASRNFSSSAESLLSTLHFVPGGQESPLFETEQSMSRDISVVRDELSLSSESVKTSLLASHASLSQQCIEAEGRFQIFAETYAGEVAKLNPEQQRLLEQHRQIAEDTKNLDAMETEQELARQSIVRGLTDLVVLCDQVAATLDEKSSLRASKIEQMNQSIVTFGVRLILGRQNNSLDFQNLARKYGHGSTAFQTLRDQMPERLAHLSYKKFCNTLLEDLTAGLSKLIFDYADFSHFLTAFEDDDLQIEFKVGKQGQEYSPINELSAGQRCTAVFPILMKLGSAPLFIDQPEDNLDNRYIAKFIAPLILQDKKVRQILFTSHNANLVVLSDPECITCFDSDGSTGTIECKGFLSTTSSNVTKSVIDILDGGESALNQRLLKYGQTYTR